MLNQTLAATGDILRLRGGPQNLPTSYGLLAAVAVIYVAASALMFRVQGAPAVVSVLEAATVVLLLVAYLRILLNVRKFSNRLPQTLTAQLIVGVLFNILAYQPIALVVPHMANMQAGTAQPPAFAVLVLLALSVWSLIVNAHILRVALEIRMVAAVGLTLLYELLSFTIVGVLFSGAHNTAQ